MKSAIENHILGLVCSVFDAYSAVLFLPEEDSDQYYLAASFSLGNNIPDNVAITPGKGLVGWIIQDRNPILLAPFDQPESALGYYARGREESIKAFMGCPLPTGGALCVDSKKQYSFSEKDFKILGLFAELLSKQQTLSQNDLAGDIPRYFAELGVIQNLRFRYKKWPTFLKNYLSTMRDATDFEYCAFATLREKGEYYCLESESPSLLMEEGDTLKIPLGSGIAGWVFLNEQSVIVEGLEGTQASPLFGKLPDMPEFSAFMCIPVMVNKSCRGVLCLASSTPRQIDESLRSFVRQAVDHLGLFLENLYLTNRLRNMLPKATLEHGHPYSAAQLRPNSDNAP